MQKELDQLKSENTEKLGGIRKAMDDLMKEWSLIAADKMMVWLDVKPKNVGLYFRSNPALQQDITQQLVFRMDGELWTFYPSNETMGRVKISKLPDNFKWLKIPIPDHWKITLDYDKKNKK